jgi:V/A-type H+-transporting ATPase subunit E
MGGNIDALIGKVTDDARKKAENVIKDAESNARKSIELKLEQARAQSVVIIKNAQTDAASEKERIIAGASLAARDKKLRRKRAIIEKTLELAALSLKKLPDERYEAFLTRYLLKLPLEGGETIVIPERHNVNIDAVRAALKPKIGDKDISFEKAAGLSGGFMLLEDGVENNNTYEALIDYYREELETIIAENLF